MTMGWICPGCHRCNSPEMIRCDCTPPNMIWGWGTNAGYVVQPKPVKEKETTPDANHA